MDKINDSFHKNLLIIPQRQMASIRAIEVFDILAKNSPMELSDLKTQSGLSNKQWDKSIKGLTKAGVAKVSKSDAGLTVKAV